MYSIPVCILDIHCCITWGTGWLLGWHRMRVVVPPEGSQVLQQEIGAFAEAQQRSNKPCSHKVEREITRILLRWTWLDIRPIAIVRDKGLKELLNFLGPKWNYQLPSTTQVSALIRKDFDDGKAALSAGLGFANSIALITDVWKSKATQVFATMTALRRWRVESCILRPWDNPLSWQPLVSRSHTGVQTRYPLLSMMKQPMSFSLVRSYYWRQWRWWRWWKRWSSYPHPVWRLNQALLTI